MSDFTDKFVAENEGKTLGFPEGMYVGECLSLVKHYIQQRYGIYPPASGCGAARCYWSKFPNPLGTVLKKVTNTPDLIPKKGWIAVWDEDAGGGYGHIAIVLEANINTFVSFDQNWGGRHAHKVTHNYNNVYGFLAPLEEGGDMVEVPSEKFEELVTKSSEYDKFVKAGYSSASEVEERVNKLETDNRKLSEDLEECRENCSDETEVEETFEVSGKKEILHPDGTKTVETSYKVRV